MCQVEGTAAAKAAEGMGLVLGGGAWAWELGKVRWAMCWEGAAGEAADLRMVLGQYSGPGSAAWQVWRVLGRG